MKRFLIELIIIILSKFSEFFLHALRNIKFLKTLDKLQRFTSCCLGYKMFRETKHYLDKNQIKFYIFEAPEQIKIKGFSKEELNILNKHLNSGQLLNDMEYLQKVYKDNEDCFEFAKTRYKGTRLYNNGTYIQAADYNSKYYNVSGGIRFTDYQPLDATHCIRVFGSCIARGFGVSDQYTIESYLQKMINTQPYCSYMVMNYGTGGKTGNESFINDLLYIQNTPMREGDIVIFICYYTFLNHLVQKLLKNNFKECSPLFHSPHNYGWWFLNSTVHLNHHGNEVVAKFIFDNLKSKLHEASTKEGKDVAAPKYTYNTSNYKYNKELQGYLEELKKHKLHGKIEKNKIGAIVMNCNPFTLGHRYLIEEALKNVDYLYVFVVEENKSFFSFEDRFDLVKKGTSDLKNIEVLPSGKFIVSSLTFPEYFQKEEEKDITINATDDLFIFGNYIAPTLNITERFAGEEPLDKVTKQYNDAMEQEFKKHGIHFQCIPRKEVGDECISASKVRKYLKEDDFDSIRRMVPDTTYQYLLNHYK